MCIAVIKDFDLLILWNGVSRLGNVHIWLVPPCYDVDLLMFRNCVLNMKTVQIWAVLNCKMVYFRIVRYGILK